MIPRLQNFVIVLLCFAANNGAQSAFAKRPNVLFLVCDDLNCDLGSYGHDSVESPSIDALAKRGIRFDRAYCQYPLCGPSRCSFLTGLYPDQTQIHKNAVEVRRYLPKVLTLPQHFKENGYFSARIGKLYHYGVPSQIGTGGHDDPFSWNQTINPRGRDKDDEHLVFTIRKGKYGGTLSWLAADGTDEEQTDGIAATRAIDMLEKFAAGDQPFFLAVGLFRPHTPYVAPKSHFERYPIHKIKLPKVPDGYLQSLPPGARWSLTRKKDQQNLPEELGRQAIQAYRASTTFADAQLGRILAALQSTGLADNTVVVFTSDHGYHMGEHGHWQKTTLFENAARVPLIIAMPDGTASGGQIESPVEMIDLFPTLAEMCGLPVPKHLPGVSLSPAFRNESIERDSALTQYANGYSLRTKQYRYTEWNSGNGGIELYDHSTDPDEMKNLADDSNHAKIVEEMRGLLKERMASAMLPVNDSNSKVNKQ